MKILFLGDFYFDYDEIPNDLFKISEYIKKNNLITILNLEGTIKSETLLNKGTHLSFKEKYLETLKLLNVKAVNLANNHIMDYKEEGFKNLINQLNKSGIGYFGAGMNLEEAKKTYIINDDKKRVALIGMGWKMEECINATNKKPGTCPLDFKLLNEIINNENADIFIPILHMGYEYENLPQPYHLKKCRELIKNEKVKLVIGHHPHVTQAYEKKIFYSLGNFFFGSIRNNFNKKKERTDCNQGIGIVYDTDKDTYEILKFEFDGENSKINNSIEINNLKDITNIPTDKYTKYFYKNNKFKNKKYVYKTGSFNELFLNEFNYIRRSTYKKFLKKIKWPLIKIIKKVFRRS